MMVILDDLVYLLLLFLSIVLIGNSLNVDLRHWLLSKWSRGTGRLLLLVG